MDGKAKIGLFEKSLILYILLSLTFPNLILRGLSFRLEIILSIIIFLFFIAFNFKRPGNLLRVNRLIIFEFIYVIYFLFVFVYNNYFQFNIILFTLILGQIRILLITYLFYKVQISTKFLTRLNKVIIFAGLFNSILSIFQASGLKIAQELTLKFYSSIWRAGSIVLFEEYGRVLRSTGFFETPPFNAVFTLFFIAYLIFYFNNKSEKIKNYLVLFTATLAGFSTLTSTFLVGFIILNLLILIIKKSIKTFLFNIGIFIVLTIFFMGVGDLKIKNEFNYQIEKIKNGELFNSRYGREAGILVNAINAVKERPFTGSKLSEETFVGDSLYLFIAYHSGIIGLGLFFLILADILVKDINNAKYSDPNRRFRLLITILMIILGIGVPSFFILRLQELYWAIIGMKNNYN